MNTRKLVNQRPGKIRRFFRPIAMAAMLAVATIMPLKRAGATKERKAKVMKVQKPEWAKPKKEKPGGPDITLTLFGGAYGKLKAPFVGAGVSASQDFGPVNVTGLFEIAAIGPEKLVVENAQLTTTLLLRRPEYNKGLPLSISLYSYRGRICFTDSGFGGTFNIGSYSVGVEYDFPGPAVPVFGQKVFSLLSGDLSLTPGLLYVTNMELLGGYLNSSYKITGRLSAQSQVWYLVDPASPELLAINWRLGVSTSF